MPGMKQLYVVVGGQFGSEGKGAFIGALLARERVLFREQIWAAVRVAGPNAGHTVYTDQDTPSASRGTKVVVRSVPAAVAIAPHGMPLLVGPGSEVDVEVLHTELHTLDALGLRASARLYVHEQATLLEAKHRDEEGGNDGPMQLRIGSTGKGVGAARSDRIMRTASVFGWEGEKDYRWRGLAVPDVGYRALLSGRNVLIEGTQGYGLGLHAGYYPFCTSSDCTAADFVGMAGLAPWEYTPTVWLVVRTFPIRVAGNSGPLPFETTWEKLGEKSGGYIEPEYTTVTKKLRRVADYDPGLVYTAVQANGPSVTRVALMFADYIDPRVAGAYLRTDLTPPVLDFVYMVEETSGARVSFVGTGPKTGVWL